MSQSLKPSPPPSEGRHLRSIAELLRRFEAMCGPLEVDGNADAEEYPVRQCAAAAEILAFDAVTISLTLGDAKRVPVAASSADAREAESLEFTLGHGPSLHALTTNRVILLADAADHSAASWSQWREFSEELLARTSFRAVFAIPLSYGGLTIGTMCLYRREPGMPDHAELGEALAVATRIFYQLIESGTFDGSPDPVFRWSDMPLAMVREVVWQAIGMATVQLDVSWEDALALLRSYSFSHDLLLDEVAEGVVTHSIPLDDFQL